MLNILYIPGYRYPESNDEPVTCGDLRYSINLSKSLSEIGHKVDILSRANSSDQKFTKLINLRIYRYRSEFRRIFSTSFDISINRYLLFTKLVSRNKYDLIICNSPLTLELIKYRNTNIPIIYICSGMEDIKNYSKSLKELLSSIGIKWLRDPFKRITWNLAKYVVSTACEETKTLENLKVNKDKIVCIGPSVDTQKYTKKRTPDNYFVNKYPELKNRKIILSVSRFTPSKGIKETIYGFYKLNKLVPDTLLVIAGVNHSHSPKYFQEIKQLILTIGMENNVKLIENVEEEYLPDLFSIADVFTAFSIMYDPLPTVIIEAMACEAPVVSTYYSTREQYLDDMHTGIFVEMGNVDEWVIKCKLLLENTEFKNKIVMEALKQVRTDFNIKDLGYKYISLILNNELSSSS